MERNNLNDLNNEQTTQNISQEEYEQFMQFKRFQEQQRNNTSDNNVNQQYYDQGNYEQPTKSKGIIIAIVIIVILGLLCFCGLGGIFSSGSSSKSKSESGTNSSKQTTDNSNKTTENDRYERQDNSNNDSYFSDKSDIAEQSRHISHDVEFTTDMNNLGSDLQSKLSSYEYKGNEWFTNSIGDNELILIFEAQQDDRGIKIQELVTDSSGNVLYQIDDSTSVSKGHLGAITLYQDSEKLSNSSGLNYKFTVEEYTPVVHLGSDKFDVVNYNLNDDMLYITLQAYSSDVSSFSGIGALFYKNGKLINADYTYPTDGWDSNGQAICSIWLYKDEKDFDNIVFYYE